MDVEREKCSAKLKLCNGFKDGDINHREPNEKKLLIGMES